MIILLLVGGSGHPKPPVYGHSELGLGCAAPVDDRRVRWQQQQELGANVSIVVRSYIYCANICLRIK